MASSELIKLPGTEHIQIDMNFHLQVLGVTDDSKVALVLSDSTPRGFRDLMKWIQENYSSYDHIYRSAVPFAGRHSTPAEFALHYPWDPDHINGRVRDISPGLITFEEIKGPFIGVDVGGHEWPFKHTGTFRDVVGNALFGTRLAVVPNIVNGLTLMQVFMNNYRGVFGLHELTALTLAKFDVDYKTARTQLVQLNQMAMRTGLILLDPGLPPDLPPGFDSEVAAAVLFMICKENKTLDQVNEVISMTRQPTTMDNGKAWVNPNGKMVGNVSKVTEYLKYWIVAKENDFHHKLDFLGLEENTIGIQKAREELIHVIIKRLVVTPDPSYRLSFVDLPIKGKRDYLLALYDNDQVKVDRLLNEPVKNIGRDFLFSEFKCHGEVDSCDASSWFVERLEQQIEDYHGIKLQRPKDDSQPTTTNNKKKKSNKQQSQTSNRISRNRSSSDDDVDETGSSSDSCSEGEIDWTLLKQKRSG